MYNILIVLPTIPSPMQVRYQIIIIPMDKMYNFDAVMSDRPHLERHILLQHLDIVSALGIGNVISKSLSLVGISIIYVSDAEWG
jgi:hypothetical protein